MDENKYELPEYWPKPGERLFVPGSPGRDADVASGLVERMYWMKEAFKEAADLLSIQAEENHYEKNKFVWPIVFCYRQYLELALKEVMAKYGEQVEPEVKANWKSHRLGELWASCKSVISGALLEAKVDDIPEIQALESVINEFREVDDGSYSFRYPTDTKGRLVEFPFESIDLANLKRVMEGIYTFLDCNKEVLGTHFDGPYYI
ncbi:MAG: hypothetical protein ACJ76Y_08840 [Thermoanaerobaculia bacterium]